MQYNGLGASVPQLSMGGGAFNPLFPYNLQWYSDIGM